MWRTVVISFCYLNLLRYAATQSLSELTRPRTSGYDLNPKPRLLQGSPRSRNSLTPNGPPPIPQPPSPPAEVQLGGGFIPQEPHFGPPPIPENMGPPNIPNMPSSGGFSQLPAPPGQQSSIAIDNSQGVFGNPQVDIGVPSARNDAPNSFNPYPSYMNAMAANIQNRLAGYPAPPGQEQQRQQQQTIQTQQHPGVYTLGGLPFTPDGASRSDALGFQPPVKPPDTPEYSYDWSFNNGPKLFGGAKEDLVRINNLLPATTTPRPTKPTTRAPLRAMLLTKCVPNDIPDAVGICTPRSAAGPRRPRCGEKVQALSADCGSEELCCFEMPVLRVTETPTIQEKAIDGIAASCISPLAPNTPGLCIPKTQRARRCVGLVASLSPNCDPDEVCCFNTGSFALHDFVAQVADTTTTPASVPVAKLAVFAIATRSMCTPGIRPDVKGFCSGKTNRPRECKGMLAATSDFCQKEEVCCFVLSTTNSRAISATGGSISNQLGYFDVPAAHSTSTLTTTTIQSTTTSAISNNGGQNGTSYSLQFVPTELCVPVTNSNVFDGTCVAASNIQNVCAGLQIASSSNCPASSYCCYANRAPVISPTPSGCIPDNNPSVTNGVCIQANDLASSCIGISISPSRYCAIDSYCCYQNSQTRNSSPSSPTGSTGVSGQPTTSGQSTTSLRGTVTTTPAGSEPGSDASCTPQNNQNGQGIQNGTCVPNSQLRARCQKMQISLSLDCDMNEYCCYTSISVDSPTAANGGCIPETNPSVTNGKCVSVTKLSTVCRGIQIATSQDCHDATMFCCFNSSGTSNPNNQTGYSYDTTLMSTPPTTSTSGTTSMVTFNTSGITRSTTPTTYTTPTTSLTTGARSPLPTTSSAVFGYRNIMISGGGNSVSMPVMANRTCSPQGNRQIQNGVCVSSMQIGERCRGIQISPSLQCTGDEYCCYQSDPPLDLRPGGACIPAANQRILNGVCVDPDQLSTTCRGVQMSASRNCRNDQFCCYNTNDQFAWGWGSNTGITQRVVRPPGSCKPAGVSEDSGTSGICVDLADVMVACKAWQIARSEDCRSMQYCCFSQDQDTLSPKNGNAVPSSAQLGNRDAIRLAQVAQQASSINDNYGGYSNYYSVGRPATTAPATTSRSTATTSRTTTRPRTTLTPLTSITTLPMPSRSCRPMSNNAVSNGVCVANTAIAQACSGIQVSPSLSCYASELCCFTAPPEDTTTVSPYPSACRPDTETRATGLCVSLSTNPNVCTGRRISSSKDCATRQYCCFSMEETTSQPNTTVFATTEVISPEEDVTTTTPQSPNNPEDDPMYCPHPQGCCTADYADQGMNGKGMCVDVSQVATACKGIEIATSRNCDIGQLCCYSHRNQSVFVPPGPDTLTTTSTSSYLPTTATTPRTTPTTTSTTATTTYTTPTITRTTRTQPTTTSSRSTTTTSTTTPSTVTTVTTVTTRTTSTPTTRKPSSNKACFPGSHSLAASQGQCVADWQIPTACLGLQLSSSLDCDYQEFCCYIPVLITTPKPNQEGFCIPDYAPTFFDGRCVDSSQLSARCAGVDISPSANCGLYQMCCYNISSSSTLGTTGPLLYYTDAPKTSSQTPTSVTNPTTSSTISTTTSTTDAATVAPDYPSSESATDSPAENGCIPGTSPNARGFCVALENLASQCAGIQASNSRGCSYGQMCCFRQLTEIAREGESNVDAGEVSVTSVQGRSDARVVPRTATAVKIPYSWPKFLR